MYRPADVATAESLDLLRQAALGPRRTTLMQAEAARIVALVDSLALASGNGVEFVTVDPGETVRRERCFAEITASHADRILHWVACGKDCDGPDRCEACPLPRP